MATIHVFFQRVERTIALCSLALLMFATGCNRAPAPKDAAQSPAADDTLTALISAPLEVPKIPNPGFVGPDACRACHAERVEEFMHTNHAHTFRMPTVEKMPDGFQGERARFETRFPGLRFEMSQDANEFFVSSVRATETGEQRTTKRIDLILGAGTADDVYIHWDDEDRMFELPMAWLWPFDHWGAAFFDPHLIDNYTREITPRCVECHNTWFQHVPGTPNQYHRDEFILGVTCERCHGPAQAHVAFHEQHPDEKTSQKILHPGTLERERLIEVCTQCHANALKHRGPAFQYRPGEPLEDYYRALIVEQTEDDHVANQIKYLRQSACFQQTEMTCITCHDPHHRSESEDPTLSCRQCHQPEHCGESPRLPEAVRDDCIGCHMPPYIKINVNFQTEDDSHVPPIRRYEHRIAVHPQAPKEVLWRWYSSQSAPDAQQQAELLRQELIEHYRKEAQDCEQQTRFMGEIAAWREALRFGETPELQAGLEAAVARQTALDDDWFEAMHLFNQQDYATARPILERVLETKPDHADAHGRLGAILAQVGEYAESTEHLAAVAKHDPNNAYGIAMLGWMQFLNGKAEEALESFRQANEIEPHNAKIHFQMALAWGRLSQNDEAIAALKQTLEIDPNYVDALISLNQIYAQDQQLQTALEYAQRAAVVTRYERLDVLMTLSQTYAMLEKFPEAIQIAQRALKVAESTPALRQLAPQIQQRINELVTESSQARR